MADTYRMPTPTPPTDKEMDLLDQAAENLRDAAVMTPEVRQVIRAQRSVIRRLRIELAGQVARANSLEAVMKMASDERTAIRCPGYGTPPEKMSPEKDVPGVGRCSICQTWTALDGEVIGDHDIVAGTPSDPPV